MHPAALVLPQLPVAAFRSEVVTIIFVIIMLSAGRSASEEGDLEDIVHSLK